MYGLLAGGVVAIGLVTWLIVRGGDEGAAKPAPTVEEAGTDEATAGGGEATAPTTTTAPAPETGPSRGDAIARFSRALNAERLFAAIGQDGDTVAIQSSMCEDAGFAAILSSSAADLRAAGFRSVRCKAPHGALVFERGL